ncbi:hypothetical protein DPMN_030765 [Dreissena polymorpha]|uniref:Uncharacterized protein n=1 Tax=Dreissena polymorpha TaxID=45954 RepID=A0A9D4M1D3_DREPO|nr:hypothetical protein DPMN_030765 [Dreissena polymorpha]
MFRYAKQLRVLLVTGIILVTLYLLYKLPAHTVKTEILLTRQQIPSSPVYPHVSTNKQSIPRVEFRETTVNISGFESLDLGIAKKFEEGQGIGDGQSETNGGSTAITRDKESADVQITNTVSHDMSTSYGDTSNKHEVEITNLPIMNTIPLINRNGNESVAKLNTPVATNAIDDAKFQSNVSQNQGVGNKHNSSRDESVSPHDTEAKYENIANRDLQTLVNTSQSNEMNITAAKPRAFNDPALQIPQVTQIFSDANESIATVKPISTSKHDQLINTKSVTFGNEDDTSLRKANTTDHLGTPASGKLDIKEQSSIPVLDIYLNENTTFHETSTDAHKS